MVRAELAHSLMGAQRVGEEKVGGIKHTPAGAYSTFSA